MKKALLYGSIVIVAFVLIAWKLNSNKKENAKQTEIVKEGNTGVVPVLVQKISLTEPDQNFLANGNFAPVHEIQLLSEISGRIKELYVKEGSVVKQGQVLARVDNEVINADLQSARSSLSQAKVDKERYEKAFQSGGVTQKQVDDMKVQYENAEAKYVAARRKVDDSYIKAPISGTINAKYVEVGSYLALSTKLFEIVDINRLKLAVTVPEAQVVNLQNGQNVVVTSNVFPEANYNGKISFIAAKGDNSMNYPVEIEVTNIAGKELKAGMYGTANFEMPKQQPSIFVPRTAFYGGVNSNLVFVFDNGVAKTRKVVAGRILGDKVEVRDGLKEGETVITSGQVNLADGVKVSIQ